METMCYKPSDKVRIKSLDWYNENKDELGNVGYFSSRMKQFCGQIAIINKVVPPFYHMENVDIFLWTDEMIEGLVEEDVDLIPKFGEFSNNEPLDIPTMTTEFVKEHGLPCPEGYIFKDEHGNVINATKIVLEKKKKEYPKTYEECCNVLDTDDDSIIDISVPLHYNHLLISFTQLLICRDAYWKIAGEEMGLGKPWEPDYDSLKTKYTIVVVENKVVKLHTLSQNHILTFPTEAMRDVFYENFKEEIEICKKLL